MLNEHISSTLHGLSCVYDDWTEGRVSFERVRRWESCQESHRTLVLVARTSLEERVRMTDWGRASCRTGRTLERDRSGLDARVMEDGAARAY